MIPYMYSKRWNTRRNQPDAIWYVIEKLSEIYQVSVEVIIEYTTKNTNELFFQHISDQGLLSFTAVAELVEESTPRQQQAARVNDLQSIVAGERLDPPRRHANK